MVMAEEAMAVTQQRASCCGLERRTIECDAKQRRRLCASAAALVRVQRRSRRS